MLIIFCVSRATDSACAPAALFARLESRLDSNTLILSNVLIMFAPSCCCLDVVIISIHDQRVKYRIVISKAALITFCVHQLAFKKQNDNPQKRYPCPSVGVLPPDRNVCGYLDVALRCV